MPNQIGEMTMTKVSLCISVDFESGTGELTQRSKEFFEEMVEREPLFAADVLKDILYDFETYYNRAVPNICPSLKALNARSGETLQ